MEMLQRASNALSHRVWDGKSTSTFAFRPIYSLHFGPASKKNSIFCPIWGNEEGLRGTKKENLHQILVHFLGPFLLQNWEIMRFLGEMWAADQSNAKIFNINFLAPTPKPPILGAPPESLEAK